MPAPDPFAAIRAQTNRHRAEHAGCQAYPFADGRLLGVVAAASGARRILELGTALGYTALWLAHGAPDAQVDTVERDPVHVGLARAHFQAAGLAGRIHVHEGEFAQVLAALSPGYDLGFFDGYTPAFDHLAAFRGLLRPRGVLLSTNLSHGGAQHYRDALFKGGDWLSAFVDGGHDTALSIKL